MEKIYSVKGVDKNLDVYDNKVVLTSKKMRGPIFWLLLIGLTLSTFVGGLIFYFVWNMGNGKEKTIYIKNIKSIELKKPTRLVNGVIQFNLDDSANYGNTWGAENSVAFGKTEDYETCSEVRDFIETKIAA